MPRAPSTHPARISTGGTLSMPSMMPLAIDGAAPRTTTNRIAFELRLNSTIASGYHATDGIVCKPVIIEPTPARKMRERDTAIPTTPPTTIATANPMTARCSVTHAALVQLPRSWTNWSSTVNGDGRMYCGFHPVQTITCQTPMNSPTATSFGHRADHTVRPRAGRVRSSASDAESAVSTATVRSFLAQPVGDRRRKRRDFRGIDAARAGNRHVENLRDAARSAREQHHAIAEPDRLTNIVGHEQHGLVGFAPQRLELVVQ